MNAGRVVRERFSRRIQADGFEQILLQPHYARTPKRPRHMLDIRVREPSEERRIQPESCRQKNLAIAWFDWFTDRNTNLTASVLAPAGIFDLVASRSHAH